MYIKKTYVLNKDDILRDLASDLVIECIGSSNWNTGVNKRRFNTEFSPSDKIVVERLRAMYYKWHIKTGIPETISFSPGDYKIAIKLKRYCAEYFAIQGKGV